MSGRRYGFMRKLEAKEKREKQYQMVLDLGSFFEHPPEGMVHDTSLLPHSKSLLVEALLDFIETAKNPDFINICEILLLALTNYQNGVGSKSIRIIALPENFDAATFKEAWASSDMERWEDFSDIISLELQNFGQKMAEAKQANLHLQPTWKKLWQKFRQQGLYSPFYEGHEFP